MLDLLRRLLLSLLHGTARSGRAQICTERRTRAEVSMQSLKGCFSNWRYGHISSLKSGSRGLESQEISPSLPSESTSQHGVCILNSLIL